VDWGGMVCSQTRVNLIHAIKIGTKA